MRWLTWAVLFVILATQAFAEETKPAASAAPSKVEADKPTASASPVPSKIDALFKNEKSKVSYAIGVQFGTSLKNQSIDADLDQIFAGVKDTLSDKNQKITLEESRMITADYSRKLNQQLADKNKTEGEAFLAENKKKDGVQVRPSGLQYKILKASTGRTPTATDTVLAHYRGTLLSGKEFDSSHKRGQPATLPVGRVIPGWTEAIQLMPVGSKWQIFVPASLAYGERSAGPIPPNSTLIFEIELLDIK